MSDAKHVSEERRDRIKFDYIKSNLFRVVYADGVFGGVTPKGFIHMAFYNERQPIPKQVVYSINENGTLGSEIKEDRVERDAIVREVEFDVVIDTKTAKLFIEWLQERSSLLKNFSRRLDRGKFDERHIIQASKNERNRKHWNYLQTPLACPNVQNPRNP